MTMPWQVAIPSYRRARTLLSKTLPTLLTGDVPMDRVTVFLANDAERLDYEREWERFPQVPRVRLVTLGYDPEDQGPVGDGPYGLGLARNLLLRHYPRGTLLAQIDDDIRGFLAWAGQRDPINCRSEPLRSVALLLDAGFAAAQIESADLWGLHPARTYMRNDVRVGLYYIGGGLFGHTVRGDDAELVTLDDKEDYERTLRFFIRDGAVVRLDWATWNTTGYGGEGGMQSTRTEERIRASAEWLAARYPELASLNLTKKSGKAEVRLRRPR
jgi:hypothetical protein